MDVISRIPDRDGEGAGPGTSIYMALFTASSADVAKSPCFEFATIRFDTKSNPI